MSSSDKTQLHKLKIVFGFRDIDLSLLTHLYLPLIGIKAFSGYLWLHREGLFLQNEIDLESSLNRLANHLEIPFEKIKKEVLNPLEGVSLVKTYLVGDSDCYVCELSPPLSVTDFLEKITLSVLAKNIIGKSDWERTIAFFLKEPQIPTSALNVSKKFNTFYKEAMKRVGKIEEDAIPQYDFMILDARLKEKGLEVELRKPIRQRIIFLANLYSFHPGDVADVIEKCLNDHEGRITIKALASCFSDLYEEKAKREPEMFFDLKENEYFGNIKPVEFIDLYEGRAATLDEIDLIQKLAKKFEFDSEVINTLLHFSFIKNKRINSTYILKIADTLKKGGLTEVKQVQKHLKLAYKKAKNKSPEGLTLSTTEIKMDEELDRVGQYFENRDKK